MSVPGRGRFAGVSPSFCYVGLRGSDSGCWACWQAPSYAAPTILQPCVKHFHCCLTHLMGVEAVVMFCSCRRLVSSFISFVRGLSILLIFPLLYDTVLFHSFSLLSWFPISVVFLLLSLLFLSSACFGIILPPIHPNS